MKRSPKLNLLTVGALTLALCGGCGQKAIDTAAPKLTSSKARAERRAYDGSPPVIPHEPLGAACSTCHTEAGKPVPNMAFAPANPHGNVGSLQNCRQCHLFKRGDGQFAEAEFSALAVAPKQGNRLYPGAPPTIPHSTMMRANCNACHDGLSARPEIRCSHPDRVNCVQCHVQQTTETEFIVGFDSRDATP